MPASRRRRRSDRRARVSRAVPRERGRRRSDERARAPAPARIRERFRPRERIEFIVGLGEALYLRRRVRRGGDVFDSMLRSGDLLAGDARERVLDWWASALDRDARPRPEIERQGVYQRIRERMRRRAGAHPGSGAAAYWLAAAARGQGDLQAAWDAAQAGWVRAPLAPDRGAPLRADLDRLVPARDRPRAREGARRSRRRPCAASGSGSRSDGASRRVQSDSAASRLSSSRRCRRRPSAARSAPPPTASGRGRARRTRRRASLGTSNSSSSWTVRIIRASGCGSERRRGRRSSRAS